MIISAPPDLRLFWTAYDPLDLASGSIDVLGFLRGYIALADKILPGFTTVTTSPRYVSMLCAAIRVAQDTHPDSSGETSTKLRQKRLEAVKSYERAWAFACGLAAEEGISQAVDGLRGIMSVRRKLNEMSARDKTIRTNSYNLLSNQVRYGGIGAYSVLLEECHLASMRSISLRPLGEKLAAAFAQPSPALAVQDENRPLPIEELRNWGRQCHLGVLSRSEGKILSLALQGGEEVGSEDEIRWSMLRFLASEADADQAESRRLERILKGLQRNTFGHLQLPGPCLHQIQTALTIIAPYERLYQALQFLFGILQAAATDEPEPLLDTVAGQPSALSAYEAAKVAATDLSAAVGHANELDPQCTHDLQAVLGDSGISVLLPAIQAATSPSALLVLILGRHRDVQQGKFDQGERKAPWVRYEPADGKVRLTAQRYQLPVSGRPENWTLVPWHPYRTFGALQFVRQCKIS